MKVHLRMLGCRLNQSEIDMMARQFEQLGHEVVNDPAEAEHFVVNTCAVTNQAAKDGRKLIRELHRTQSEAEISVTGCYAQISPDDIQVLPGVKRVVGNQEKDQVVTTITGQALPQFDLEPVERDPLLGSRSRAFVKVQDGCDNSCTFCVTTVARGAGKSRSAQEIIEEINYLYSSGCNEAVLTGVHLGSYGHDLGNPHGLMELTRMILQETDMPRIRLSSLEPWDLAPDFFSLWEDARICRHLHLPLQSGCDATLKRMRRNTSQVEFRGLVEEARKAIMGLRLTTDVIVGFPGETETEFGESEAFIYEMDFAGLHVFRYSVRPETPAAKMKGHVLESVKKERSRRLLTWAKTQESTFASTMEGQTHRVLWESVMGSSDAGFTQVGYTDNYVRARCVHPRVLTNTVTDVEVQAVQEGVVECEVMLI